jgi:hypothetical protein
MSEYLRASDFFDQEPRPEPVKVIDEEYRFRGYHDRHPDGICRVRLFHREGATPVLVISEHPENQSTSVTNAAEFLACEIIRDVIPERFEYLEPAIILEHYAEIRDPRGRLIHEETWDRLSFESWAPRLVWIGGQQRLSFGAPEWRSLPRREVIALIGAVDSETTDRPDNL